MNDDVIESDNGNEKSTDLESACIHLEKNSC